MNSLFNTKPAKIKQLFNIKHLKRYAIYGKIILLSALLVSCQQQKDPNLREMIAQKLMLEIHYYCKSNVANPEENCHTPMKVLPPEFALLIEKESIGGVIWFSDNLESTQQILKLNQDVQSAAERSSLSKPLFIAIDQEGGRVTRLPRQESTVFSGNMAIGATWKQHGDRFGREVGRITGEQLAALGFNVNFAPVVDINNNPANPVINVRSFSDNPKIVAELGAAYVEAIQQTGVLATLKHFPGHGDTSVDSHTDLPRVDHDQQRINKIELYPYANIIAHTSPAFVMSAHIQYPTLDSTVLHTPHGDLVRPATLSPIILNDILRKQLKFKGLIVTDALNMKGITKFFTPDEAVEQAFLAGVDVALMPFLIRTPNDIQRVSTLLDHLTTRAEQNPDLKKQIESSWHRIQQTKSTLTFPKTLTLSAAENVMAQPKNKEIEQQLSDASITQVKPTPNRPLPSLKGKKLLLAMPDPKKCEAFNEALIREGHERQLIRCQSILYFQGSKALQNLAWADLLIAASISPGQSAAEIGGIDDRKAKLEQVKQPEHLQLLIEQSNTLAKPVIFISLRAPYDIQTLGQSAEVILTTYNYSLTQQHPTQGLVYDSLARVLLGKISAQGHLPLTLTTPSSP